MPKVKQDYSPAELASIIGISRQAVEKMASKQLWPSKPREGRGGGQAYQLVDLPDHIRQAIIADAFGVVPELIHNVDLPMEKMEAMFAEFHATPEKSQNIAKARTMILEACRRFTLHNRLAVTAGRKAFSQLYQQKSVPDLQPEVYELVSKASPATIERWEAAWRKYGLAGLTSKAHNSGRDKKVTPEMAMIFRAAIAKTPHIRGCKLVELMRTLLPKEDWCDRATVFRWFKKWREENIVEHTMNINPSDYKNKYMPAFGSLATAPHAGHTWEMDSTPADIMTADGKRCAIVAAIDVYSRRVVMVVANTSCSQTVAMCMRKGLMTFGRPEVIRKDNGKDYSSKHILAVTSALKIETPHLQAYKSEAKGIIERFFGTISTDLEEMLPGYTGHSVAERAALRAQNVWAKRVFTRPKGQQQGALKAVIDVPLTQGELMHLIECWLDVYENRVHSGFANEPGRKLKGLTPVQAFERSAHKPKLVKHERALDLLLAEVDSRTVGKKGIRYQNGFYHDADLVPHIGREVIIKLHPENAGAIYVFSLEGEFICVARDEALEGQRLSDYIAAQKTARKRITERIKAADVLSRNIPVSYTVNLLNGKIAEANHPAGADPDECQEVLAPLEFRPEYQSPATDEARKAYEAYDGTARPVAAPAPDEPLRLEPRHKIIYPKSPEEKVDPLYPTGRAAGNPITLFEYYMHYATGPGLDSKEAHHIFRLWDNYPQVQKMYPRPDEERLNIIETEIEPEPIKQEVCL